MQSKTAAISISSVVSVLIRNARDRYRAPLEEENRLLARIEVSALVPCPLSAGTREVVAGYCESEPISRPYRGVSERQGTHIMCIVVVMMSRSLSGQRVNLAARVRPLNEISFSVCCSVTGYLVLSFINVQANSAAIYYGGERPGERCGLSLGRR